TPPGLRRMDELIGTMRAFTVAHEVAHQYFAGLVGADCREHPAVDEPLAQFAAGQVMEKVHGRAGGRALLEMNAKMNYGVYRMLGGKDLPAGQPVTQFPTALAYAAIVYGKAPYFYVALRDRLGADRFDEALRKTVDRFRFKLVTLDQWIAELEKNAGGPSSGVAAAAKRWLHEAHGDADLGVDGSGRAVLTAMLGEATYKQLARSLGALGMSPASLFRMVMGKAGGGAGASGGGGGGGGGLGSALGDLLKSLKGLTR
ncbi:MAG: hypothetical protein KC503_41225, partial [Myxococcales bacterium]|nr:hypothetical protein [Myxococcales bacterium]